ncbi:immunity 53 family protein [Pectobacterium brasiliense]|uniref:immunity 53 family protein n=1 Tax=Pectobacterium brasiliense TaxID=180957 RepID=UPI0039861BF5
MNELQEIQRWYQAQCNGKWEHAFGISIDTLDNPGWRVKIDLAETSLTDKPFTATSRGKHPEGSDWIFCKTEKLQFIGFCGVGNLAELLTIFLNWCRDERT